MSFRLRSFSLVCSSWFAPGQNDEDGFLSLQLNMYCIQNTASAICFKLKSKSHMALTLFSLRFSVLSCRILGLRVFAEFPLRKDFLASFVVLVVLATLCLEIWLFSFHSNLLRNPAGFPAPRGLTQNPRS